MTLADVAQKREGLIKEYARHSKDTGSSEVQVALLTSRIENLTIHFSTNKKDQHSKTGMMKLIARRKSLLTYLKSEDIERYRALIEKLGLRK